MNLHQPPPDQLCTGYQDSSGNCGDDESSVVKMLMTKPTTITETKTKKQNSSTDSENGLYTVRLG